MHSKSENYLFTKTHLKYTSLNYSSTVTIVLLCWHHLLRSDVQVAVLSMHMPDFNNISFLCNTLNNHTIITNTQVLKILNLVFSFFHTVGSTEEILNPRSEKIVWRKGQRLNMPPLKNNVLSNWFPQSVTEIKATNVRTAYTSLMVAAGVIWALNSFSDVFQEVLVTLHIPSQNFHWS